MQTETITCLVGTAPLIIAVFISLISLACVFIQLALCLPQDLKKYFKDLKDSRDKKILNALREEVIKEIYKERNNNLSTISRFETKNIVLQREIETLERKIRTYDSQLKDIEKVRNILAR